MVATVQTALVQMRMTTAPHVDPLMGVGIGSESHTGTARTAASADEAIEKLEPGDVLVVRATSPAFNAVLAIAGAVVTATVGRCPTPPCWRVSSASRRSSAPRCAGHADGSLIEVDPRVGVVRVLTG